ncbi:thiol-disulfide isomerase/thioredoxin [Yokenella regensburgei]|jgi:thiol-disulfide isomerase/thioredoxin|uniref:Thiol-disulfide isomerase/thioredoxin n=1 Tax=Yokenella regensburgei TaxID=158877 RepID=A0ABX9RXL8_9ENTR|nr:protein disulfide oxidoreductase [Yokenella regensburgei]EHM49408.1 antioxidant, AhpC/TSA family [Yokenella regensburgei ATCC 43003]MDQ4430649.1 protein disulfide oxidoreductase [Yokenella regensburgei]RKR54662.1 thiol-disulfide isomerase/thioredoxin [Yokenella regensburgei]VFS25308.1 Stage IV sporulation protein H [Yokenella regensburgei]
MRSKLRRWMRELVVLLLLAMAVMWGMDQLRKPVLPADFSGMPMQTLTGSQVDLAALSADRPLLLYIWATWCGICRYTTPAVDEMAEQGANVMTLAMRSGDDQELTRYLQKRQLSMPVINDARGNLARQWQVGVTPTLVVISKGKVVTATTGWTSAWGMKLRLWWASV